MAIIPKKNYSKFSHIGYRFFCDISRNIEKDRILIRPYTDFGVEFNDDYRCNLLKTNLRARDLNIDVDKLKSRWPSFKESAIHKRTLQQNLDAIENRINYLEEWNRSDEANNLRNQRNFLTNELNNVSSNFVKLETEIIPDCLRLPNKLHPDTPIDDDLIVYSNASNDNIKRTTDFHHLQVAARLALVDYRHPLFVFLVDKAAVFELVTLKFFLTELENRDYLLFSNPDIVTDLTVEGCGYDSFDPYRTFILEDDAGHLVGGASLFPFCAFSARTSSNVKFLPERRFSVGRQYVPPCDRHYHEDGLYTVAQRNAVHIFIATKDSLIDQTIEFDHVLEIVRNIYDKIGLTYRICYANAKNLSANESLRADIQLYSPYRRSYVTVGYVSVYDDYISRRLFMYYHIMTEYHFLNVISGTIINVSTLLACLLEYTDSDDDLFIPDCIKQFMCA